MTHELSIPELAEQIRQAYDGQPETLGHQKPHIDQNAAAFVGHTALPDNIILGYN